MGNSSTKLAEKCSLLSRDEVPVVASSFKFVSKNSERIKEDDLMVSNTRPVYFIPVSTSSLYTIYFTIEILGLTNGSATGSIYNKFSVWISR